MSTAEGGWREGRAGEVGAAPLEDMILETRIQLSHLEKRLGEEAGRLQQERRQIEEERASMASEREAMQKEREAMEQERQAMRFQVKEYEAVVKQLTKANAKMEAGAEGQRPHSVKRPRSGASPASGLGQGSSSSSSSSPCGALSNAGLRRARKQQQQLQAEGMPLVEEERACEAYMGYLFELTCIVTAKAVLEAFSCHLKPRRWESASQQERQDFQAHFMDIETYGKKEDEWFMLHLKYIYMEVRKAEKDIVWAGDDGEDDGDAVLKQAADPSGDPAPAPARKARRRTVEDDDDDDDSEEDDDDDDDEGGDDATLLERVVCEVANLLFTKHLLVFWIKYTHGTTAFLPAYLSNFSDLPPNTRTLCLASTRAEYEWQLVSREQRDARLASLRLDVEHLRSQYRSLWDKVPEYRGEVLS